MKENIGTKNMKNLIQTGQLGKGFPENFVMNTEEIWETKEKDGSGIHIEKSIQANSIL